MTREDPGGATDKFGRLAATPGVTIDVISTASVDSHPQLMECLPSECDLVMLSGNYMEAHLLRKYGLRIRRGLPRVYFENAVIRDGHRVYLDPIGVNARSSVRSEWERWLAGCADQCDLSFYDRYVAAHADGSNEGKLLGPSGSGRRIFVPLQIADDTVIRKESTVKSMAQEVDLARAFAERACAGNYRLFVKPHPSEKREFSQIIPDGPARDGRVVEVPKSVSSFDCIRACDLTFVNNSTVGFESLVCRKPVVTLADSVYTGLGFTLDWRSPDDTPDRARLDHYIESFQSTPCQQQLDRYLFFMAHVYTVDVRDADAVKARLAQAVDYWRSASAVETD